MQIVFHLGAYSSDVEHLAGGLMANPEVLAAHGIWCPAPASYRATLREIVSGLGGAVADDATQERVLDLCLEGAPSDVRRLVLYGGNFLSAPERVITQRGLYPFAGDRVRGLVNLFPEDDLTFCLATLNPAILLSNMLTRQSGRRSYDDILAGQPPETLLWGPVIAQIAEAASGRSFLVWANEDMPFLQPLLMRRLAGLPDGGAALNAENSLLAQLVSTAGMEEFERRLSALPAAERYGAARDALVAEVLEIFALADQTEAEVALPGWDQGFVDQLGSGYERDMRDAAAIRGVELLSVA
ncbi:hypothetical protein [Paenirhodobacter enshiensis]|uniref:Uncharacterized protein n=1 Tax=Paenirhodobacter enshiensis TaxID=1105367 RepID=A0A086XZL2_9RHOB|nr:hypothetical protein [Paenirhodobacter enshiensis]KFI27462.1 hypothetical protein CG50_15730 [Paenirhodobacter enshiensis]